jgi:hypothetical protein
MGIFPAKMVSVKVLPSFLKKGGRKTTPLEE